MCFTVTSVMNLILTAYLLGGSVLIFVTKKADSETLAASLRSNDFERRFEHQTVEFSDVAVSFVSWSSAWRHGSELSR